MSEEIKEHLLELLADMRDVIDGVKDATIYERLEQAADELESILNVQENLEIRHE